MGWFVTKIDSKIDVGVWNFGGKEWIILHTVKENECHTLAGCLQYLKIQKCSGFFKQKMLQTIEG